MEKIDGRHGEALRRFSTVTGVAGVCAAQGGTDGSGEGRLFRWASAFSQTGACEKKRRSAQAFRRILTTTIENWGH